MTKGMLVPLPFVGVIMVWLGWDSWGEPWLPGWLPVVMLIDGLLVAATSTLLLIVGPGDD
jgi:hypothetical protein